MNRQKSSPRFRFTGAALLMAVLLLLLPALKSGNDTLYLLTVLVPCSFFLCITLLARMFALDRMLLSLSLYICITGIAALAFSGPDAAITHSLCCGAGIAALLIGGVMIRSLSPTQLTSVCTAFLGLLLLSADLIVPSAALPLAEAGEAVLLISFASLQTSQGSASASLLGIAVTVLFLLRRDAAEALLWGLTIFLLLFAADGRLIIILPVFAVMLLLFAGSFCTLTFSVSEESPLLYDLVSAGAVGSDTLSEAIISMDGFSLFHHLAGRFGLLFTGLTILLFLPLSVRGAYIAGFARIRFHAVLAMGITLLIALRTIAFLLSFFGFLPLSVSAAPLLISSFSALCPQFFLIGVLCGISGRNDADLAEDAHLAILAK